MATTGGELSPKRLSVSYTNPSSLLRRSCSHGGANSHYYSSCDTSGSSTGDTLQPLTSTALDSPAPVDYLEDSSDHEREDDRESACLIRNSRGSRNFGGSIQVEDVVKAGDDHEREGCESIRAYDVVREDDLLPSYTLTFTLIPSCAVKHWKQCKLCYFAVIVSLLILILMVVSLATFWSIKLIKARPHIIKQEDLSSSAVYNVSASFPDQSNIFSSQLCLSISDSHSNTFSIDKVASVTLASERCDSVTLSPNNRTIFQNSLLGHNYMFYWLEGTKVSFSAKVNGSTVMTVFLLQREDMFNYCLDHVVPNKYLEMWALKVGSNCSLVYPSGWMMCNFEYNVTSSGYYYVCVNSSTLRHLEYNFTIDGIVYNTSRRDVAVQCSPSKECCVPFGSVIHELGHPTCVFITTAATTGFAGIRLTDISVRVDQRSIVVWYCLGLLLLLVLLLLPTIVLCRMTARKVAHPSLARRNCVIYCNIYSQKH